MQKVIYMSNFLNASPFSDERLSILSWTLKRLRLLGSPSLFLAGTWKSHFGPFELFVITLKYAHFLLIFHYFDIFSKNNRESSCGIGKRLYLCTRFRKRRRQEIVLWQIVDRKKWQGSCGAYALQAIYKQRQPLIYIGRKKIQWQRIDEAWSGIDGITSPYGGYKETIFTVKSLILAQDER